MWTFPSHHPLDADRRGMRDERTDTGGQPLAPLLPLQQRAESGDREPAGAVLTEMRKAARTAAMSLKGSAIVRPANSFGTPALSGCPWVSAPLPAWTRSESTCP